MLNSKPVHVPLTTYFRHCNLHFLKLEDEKLEIEHISYANTIGCLMFAIVLIRSDISLAVSMVSQYMASAGKEHWKGLKCIMYGKNDGNDRGL